MQNQKAVLITGILTIFAAIGLSRFGFGMILPLMQSSLNLSTTVAGSISTANFAGYLFGLFFTGFLYQRLGAVRVIWSSLLLLAMSMILFSFSSRPLVNGAVYFVTGIASALANVAIMVFISNKFSKEQRGRAAGIIVLGNGLAIMFAAILVPVLQLYWFNESWRIAWFIFSIICLIISFFVFLTLKKEGAAHIVSRQKIRSPGLKYWQSTIKIGFIYFLFGFTYVVYITYFVKALIHDWHLTAMAAGLFWAALGLISLFSGPVFGALSDKIGRERSLVIVFTLQSLSFFIASQPVPYGFLFVSVFFFGITAWSIPSIIAAMVGDYIGPQDSAHVFSQVTIIFAIGQITGTFSAGYVIDLTGSTAWPFLGIAVLSFWAALLTWRLKVIMQKT